MNELYTDSDPSYKATKAQSDVPPPHVTLTPRISKFYSHRGGSTRGRGRGRLNGPRQRQGRQNEPYYRESRGSRADGDPIAFERTNESKKREWTEESFPPRPIKPSYDTRLFKNAVYTLLKPEGGKHIQWKDLWDKVQLEEKATIAPSPLYDAQMDGYFRGFLDHFHNKPISNQNLIINYYNPIIQIQLEDIKFKDTMKWLSLNNTIPFLKGIEGLPQKTFNYLEFTDSPGSLTDFLLLKSFALKELNFTGLLISPDSPPQFDDPRLKITTLSLLENKDQKSFQESVQTIFDSFLESEKVDLIVGDASNFNEMDATYQQAIINHLLVMMKLLKPTTGTFILGLPNSRTLFTNSLIYLLNQSFDKITLAQPPIHPKHLPIRYIVCQRLTSAFSEEDYMALLDFRFNKANKGFIKSITPVETMLEDTTFMPFISRCNSLILTQQIAEIKKLNKAVDSADKYKPDYTPEDLAHFSRWEYGLRIGPVE